MSEGNVSVRQVRSLAQDDIEAADPTAERNEAEPVPSDQPRHFGGRRLWPVYGAATMSLVWLGGALYATLHAWNTGYIDVVSAGDVAAAIAGLVTPIVAFWTMALVFQRTDPLLERRLAIARSLHRVAAPVDAAEARLDQLIAKLNRDIAIVDKTVDLAAERIEALEDRFQAQLSDLFSATADAEAKAANIRDQLRREREAIEATAKDLSERAHHVQEMMELVSADISNASEGARRTADQVTQQLADRHGALANSVDEAATRFFDIADRVKERTQVFNETASRAEQILSERLNQLDHSAAQYQHSMTAIAERSDALRSAVAADAETLTALSATLQERASAVTAELGEGSAGLERAITAAETQGAAAIAALAAQQRAVRDDADHSSRALSDGAAAIEARLKAAIEQARATMAATEALFGEHLDGFTKGTADAAQMLRDQMAQLDRSAEAASQQLLDAVGNAGQDAGARLAAARDALAGKAEALVDAAAAAASKLGGELGELSDGLQGRLDALGALARHSRDEIEALGSELDARTAALADGATTARTDLEAAQGAFHQVTTELGRLEQEISARKAELLALGESASAGLDQALQRIAEQAQSIDRKIHEAASHIGDEGEIVGLALGEITLAVGNFQALTATLDDRTRGHAEAIEGASAKLQGLVDQTGGIDATLDQLAARMDAELARVKSAISDAGQAADQGAIQVGATYLSAMARSRKIAEEATDAARKAADEVVKLVEASAAKTLETLRAQGGAHAEELTQEVTSSAVRITQVVKDSLGEIGIAASRASVTAEAAARRVAKEAEGLLKETGQLTSKMTAMEERLDGVVRGDLVRTSSLIIEGLNSASIDIGRMLALDIPDTQWKRYLGGDKSIFTRAVVKLADGEQRRQINRRYQQDSDFRDHVHHYLRDFELLMARSLAGRDTNALSVTLLSSDLGKLYVLLAQSVKRLV